MGSLVPLFIDMLDFSLLEVLTPSQLKHSLCICSWCFPWALSVPRETLDNPSQWCLHLSPTPHTGPAELPRQDWDREGACAGRCLSWAVAHGKRERMAIFRSCSILGVGDCPWGKPGMASDIFWLGHPSGLAWQHGSPELD